MTIVALLITLATLPAVQALSVEMEQSMEAGWINKTSFIVGVTGTGTLTFAVTDAAGETVPETMFTPQLLSCPPPFTTDNCFAFGPRLPSVAQPVECGEVDDPQKCVEDGYTYTIKLGAASDTAIVDLSLPACAMSVPPALAKSPVPLSWTGADTGSGIRSTVVERGNGQVVGEVAGTSAAVPLPDGRAAIRCRARDHAGNLGPPSAPISVMVDTTPPRASFHHLSNWVSTSSKQYRPPAAVNISWNFSDTSVMKCAVLQWSMDNTTFINVTKEGSWCLAGTSEVVGDEPANGEPAGLQEGQIVHFRLFVYDQADNKGEMSYTFTTPDFVVPNVWMEKRVGGEPTESSVVTSSETSSIVMDIKATDTLSGLRQVKLLHRPFPGTGDFTGVVCGQPPCTMFSYIPAGIDELEVVGQAMDQAGNRNETSPFLMLRHPFVRLPAESVSLILGQEELLNVSVRNPLDVPDTVTVWMCGTTCPSYFSYEIRAGDGMTVTRGGGDDTFITVTLPPHTARSFQLLLRPSEIGSGDKLLVYGNATTDTRPVDLDAVGVAVDFAPEFPELSWWAVVILIGMAGGVFWRRTEKKGLVL